MATGFFELEEVIKPKVVECREDFFAKFKLIKEKVLGCGMSGQVVLASFQQDPNKKRAVKIFTRNKINKLLFLSETIILQKVSHPNIIADVKAFRSPDAYILSMPHCPGGSLRQHLPRMSAQRIPKYFLQLTSALLYLHANDLAHRDVKPDNVLLDANDDVILIDFGLTCQVRGGSSKIRMAGTKGFMAPELHNGHSVDLFKCDLYALGVVLWAMVFQSVPPHATDYLEDVRRCKRRLPDYVTTFLQNLLQPDQDARWDDKQLVNALYGFPEMSKMADQLWGRKT